MATVKVYQFVMTNGAREYVLAKTRRQACMTKTGLTEKSAFSMGLISSIKCCGEQK